MFGLTFLYLSVNQNGTAQTDSLATYSLDTLSNKITINNIHHSPHKAAILSTVLPGLGQAYNKKYWKIPVIYAGLGALGYSINVNHKNYIKFRTAYRIRMDKDSITHDQFEGIYNPDQLKDWITYYHRYRDLSVIGVALLYVVNIVDASVDAHLMSFDVSDDLSLNIQPNLYFTENKKNYITGLTINISFKK
ncbi:MAG: DUF5683 domain-containing protein [Bacteroidia bacterium]